MQSIFKVLQEKNQSIFQSILDSDFSDLSKVLIDFKPLVGVMFDAGWGSCPSFEAFAKPEIIDIKAEALAFG